MGQERGGGGAQAVQERGFAGGISEELGLAGTGTCSVRERGGWIHQNILFYRLICC